MTLLLVPMQAALFLGLTLTSLPANLWAVPIVSLVTVPLILLAVMVGFFPSLSYGLWWLADFTLQWVFVPLNYLQRGWIDLGAASLLASVAGWLIVFCWRFHWWWRYASGLATIAICCVLWREKEPAYRWRVDMLDVGHGLAVVIEQNGKGVLYDTGDRWPGGSAAERHILPMLNWRGIELEQIIISHDHLDHTGGLPAVRRVFPQATVRSPMRGEGHLPCVAGARWRWQGLQFEVLWPPKTRKKPGNDDSCVIRIDDGKHSLLLTGDAEKRRRRSCSDCGAIAWRRRCCRWGIMAAKPLPRRRFCARSILRRHWRQHLVTTNGVCRRVKWSPDTGQMALYGAIRRAPASYRYFFRQRLAN